VVIPAKVTKSGRIRRQFSDRKQAVTFAEGEADRHRASGPRAFALTDFEREDAAKALPLLRELNFTFQQAAEFVHRHLRPEAGEITLKSLVERIIAEKVRKNLRPDSMRSLRWNLKRISEHFGEERSVTSITRSEVEGWIANLEAEGHKGRNLKNYVTYLKQFFNYAHDHKFRSDNPAELIEPPVIEWKRPSILSIEETKRLLRTAMLPDYSDLMPALVLQLFVGGLRTEETNRLQWSSIDLSQRTVDIDPAVGKNRKDGDSITLAVGGGWLESDTTWPEHVTAFGIRGASSWRTLTDIWSPFWRKDAVFTVLQDADSAGDKWLSPGNLVETLRRQGHSVRVLRSSVKGAKDVNDVHKTGPITPQETEGPRFMYDEGQGMHRSCDSLEASREVKWREKLHKEAADCFVKLGKRRPAEVKSSMPSRMSVELHRKGRKNAMTP
jgi:hypothetical protein